jgi:hypothetical protein
VRDYAVDPAYTWTPALADVGQHALQVYVRSAGSMAVYEAWAGTGLFVVQ